MRADENPEIIILINKMMKGKLIISEYRSKRISFTFSDVYLVIIHNLAI